MSDRCTCYVRGAHGEKPRRRVLPQIISRRVPGRTLYFPPVETDDAWCPVHGIAGRATLRRIEELSRD